MPYLLRSALQSLYKEKWINLLSIFSIASSLLVLLTIFFLVYNFHIATNRLPELFSLVVYLKDEISKEDIDKIKKQLNEKKEIMAFKYYSKTDALAEFKKTVKGAGIVLEGLDENPLSSYIEVKLQKDFVSKEVVLSIAEDIKKMQGVDDVYFGERIAETINFLKKSSHAIGVFLFLIISIVVIFISYSTVKILFYRRRDEIEILKLLGATNGFIRTPFIIEGVVLGSLGGVLGSSFAVIIYLLIKYQLSTIIPIFEGIIMPWQFMPLSLLIGSLLGVIGSFIAVGKIRI